MHVCIITNKVNGKIYVGQHAGDNLQIYLAHNIKAALGNRGNKVRLYRAIRKYGPENFNIRSLVETFSGQCLNAWEIALIKIFKSQKPHIGYNITAGGGGRRGVRYKHTAEARAKIGDAHRGKEKSATWRKKIGDAQRGRKFTEEHIANLAKGQRGKSKRRSPEHCKKISDNKKLWWAVKRKEATNGAIAV